MTDTTLFTQILELALKLSPKERMQLIEQVASSVKRDVNAMPTTEEHWGKKLNELIDSLDTSDWEALDIDDPVAWVKSLRDQDAAGRNLW